MQESEKIQKILKIVEMLNTVIGSNLDPFKVDVKEYVLRLKELLPNLKELDEILMDAEALRLLARIVELQEKWVRYQASSLYVDPLIVELKIITLPPERLAEIFSRSWHPIVKIEQVTLNEIIRAASYWNTLLPIPERFRRETVEETKLSLLDKEELVKMKILTEEELNKRLEELSMELNKFLENEEKVDYWKFVRGKDYNETITRAVLLAHIISMGHASLEIKPLEEKIEIVKGGQKRQPRSFAISMQKLGERD
ncbi:MAG: hypothetical protein N3F64_01175 [Nitrososphaeria archaeon]|nr:hypothetical protein [Nitrososphaeria archaeon]